MASIHNELLNIRANEIRCKAKKKNEWKDALWHVACFLSAGMPIALLTTLGGPDSLPLNIFIPVELVLIAIAAITWWLFIRYCDRHAFDGLDEILNDHVMQAIAEDAARCAKAERDGE